MQIAPLRREYRTMGTIRFEYARLIAESFPDDTPPGSPHTSTFQAFVTFPDGTSKYFKGTVAQNDPLLLALNEVGKDGWEFVCVRFSDEATGFTYGILRRQIK